ncbi:hypothetical protein C0J52_24735 [Blattella germanica]|nr:hypothetical protein C0J52_24735 [Blattella germanica]
MWSNFVKYGNPTPNDDSRLQNVKWVPFNLQNLPFLNINTNITMQYNLKKKIIDFWEQIYQSYGANNS